MLIILTILVFVAVVHHMKKTQLKPQYSHAVLFLLLWLVVVDIALAQNYFASLNLRDKGIELSNIIARLAIGGEPFTIARFQAAFNRSLLLTFLVLLAYIAVWLKEKQTLPYKKDRYWAFLNRFLQKEHKK